MDKKKQAMVKKYSLNFPFKFEYKVISGDVFNEYLKNRFTMIFNFNKETKSSIKFGINSSIRQLDISLNSKCNSSPLVFLFYNEAMESLYDLLIMKAVNAKIYMIDQKYQAEIKEVFKIKKLLSFTLIQNKSNEQVYNDLVEKLKIFEMNCGNMKDLYEKDKIIHVITSEKNKTK